MDDLLCLDEQLNEQELMIRDLVARFVAEDVIPLMGNAFEDAVFPQILIQQTAKLGLLGLTLPVEYGGSSVLYPFRVRYVFILYFDMEQKLRRQNSCQRCVRAV